MIRNFYLALGLLILFIPGLLLSQEQIPAGAVHVVRVDGAITGATTRYLESAQKRAILSGAECIILLLDTPGGLLNATRDIVQLLLNSKVPWVVYISPSGARGASAGTMITLASHVAAMAPATHIGAAHPVSIFGGSPDKVMEDKILNDTTAWVEAIAQLRDRNVEWAISSVKESKSITASKAKEIKVIEIIADDMTDLVRQLDGMEIKLNRSTTHTLATAGKPLIHQEMSFTEGFTSTFSDPNLLFILLAIGVLGIYIEFSNPGLILPGVVGAISILVALIGMQTLPISYGALALILLGVSLLAAESFVPSFGILGIGGIASLLFGSLFLLDETQTDLRISRPMIYVSVASITVISLVIGKLLFKSLRAPPVSMQSTMVGRRAQVKEPIASGTEGRVMLNGELWTAISEDKLKTGETVEIVEVSGLVLRVKRLEEA